MKQRTFTIYASHILKNCVNNIAGNGVKNHDFLKKPTGMPLLKRKGEISRSLYGNL